MANNVYIHSINVGPGQCGRTSDLSYGGLVFEFQAIFKLFLNESWTEMEVLTFHDITTHDNRRFLIFRWVKISNSLQIHDF